MSDNQGDGGAAGSAPPPPPPPPLPEDPRSKVSPFVKKLRSAPPGHFFQPERLPSHQDLFSAPTGPYFFYGTLSNSAMLRDVLGLETEPQLRPATIIGFECKLWGQYPALLDAPGKVVHGTVYHVETKEHGERLASYETDNYRADPCRINYPDGNEPVDGFGHVFKFVGNVRDLSDGTFDLGTWLRRVKRYPRTWLTASLTSNESWATISSTFTRFTNHLSSLAIHFVPASRQTQILAMPVKRMLIVPHQQAAGTDHWCIYLSTSPISSVCVDCTPSYTVPSSVLQGGSKANIIISELPHETSPDAQTAFVLDVAPGLSVGQAIGEVTQNGRHKYEFDANGVGCRWWITDMINLFYQLQVVGNASQVAEAKAGLLKLWPDQTPHPLDQGAYYH
ncbi:hypothetical protein AOCH_000647 [Aspergillus ochraceoroseus]|uniref:Putative gamma-glutamylcyclotransferase n=1 Tax=Aspergillus ochraceoroseus TaxID=138278 RepID=A0A0F8WDG9_9EURO|nr:hypothetical protein AOCH_000647 [Aspergillus ochraceoroseus]